MSSLECRGDGVSVKAEEGEKYRVSAGSPIPAVFWVSRDELVELRDCIDKMLEYDA